ncbi:MAG TPA: metallophosphoesterase [Bacteroidales bacterium]|nr:metallophosphoesterase [Bacteroidales bacterium]
MKLFKAQFLCLMVLSVCLVFISSCKQSDRDQQEENAFSFAFLTDTHLQPERNAAAGFKQAIDTVNSLNPDFVITGGDQIMDALGQNEARADSLYDMYIEMSGLFNMPVYNTMGNHEVFGLYESSGIDSSHPLYGEKMYEKRLGERYYAFNYKGWRFYILDSVDEREEGTGYYGHVSSDQVEWLKEDLEKVDPGTPLAISVHIPFITVQTQLHSGSTEANGDGLVITNSKEVLSLFDSHNLKLVLQGHLHFLEDIYANGVHYITGGAVCASWWTGPRGDMEEGFLLVHVEGEDIDWEYVDYGWEVAVNED